MEKFKAKQIKGKGRGKTLGFPTINLEIPEDLELQDGIYASWVWFNNKKYKSALFFGPVMTFNQTEKSLEVFIIDLDINIDFLEDIEVEIELIEKIRDVVKFRNLQDLITAMESDVNIIKQILG